MEPSVRISNKLKMVVMHYDHRVATAVPHAKRHTANGYRYLLVPHKPTEVKVLRNFGYTVPAPIVNQYDWCGGTPYKHQIVTASMLSTNPRAYVLNGLGSGKTRSALFAADFLMREGEGHKALIIAPLSTLSTTWEREVFDVMPNRRTAVLHGTRKQRLQELARQDVDFYVINPDGLSVVFNELMQRPDIDIFIVDELAMFRNSRTRRWKLTKKLLMGRKWAWGMTGLPTPNGPTDAWGQARLLTPETVPGYFKQWQAMTEYQVTPFKWVARDDADKHIIRALQPNVRYATADCVDLPPTTYSTLSSDMTGAQLKAYREMVKLFYTEYKGQEINAHNAGVKTGKLLQIACGFAYTDGSFVDFGMSGKASVCLEVIDQSESKVIIFVPFTYGVQQLSKIIGKAAAAHKVPFTVDHIYGNISKTKRDRIFTAFRTNPDLKVLIAHPGVMSHGLSLTEASTIVWASPTMSYDTYEQANARIVRPGQNLHTHIINIESSPIEKYMYSRLAKKGNASTALLDLFALMTQRGL